MDEEGKWLRRIERERKARQEAERLLEQKSLELFDKNNQLKHTLENLEQIVEERTREVKRLSIVASQASCGVVITDPNGRTEWVNDGFTRITGYSLEEVVGKVPGHILQGVDTDPVTVRQMRTKIDAREPFTSEILNYTKDGKPYWVRLDANPVFNEDGSLQYFISIQTDITERKAAEEALRGAIKKSRALNLELEKTVKDLDAYAHTVAHDLRNPVVGITGVSETLRDYWDSMPEEQKREFVDMLYQSANSLEGIIRELLLLSSVRKESIKTEPVDIENIMAAVAKRLRVMIADNKAELRVDKCPTPVIGYGPWITEALANLTTNAIKYGGSPPVIRVGTEMQPDGSIMTFIDDNGSGIPEDRRKALFKEFTRIHGNEIQGHGLGLSIVMRIISKLEGTLGIGDSPLGGARFYFTLPAGDQ